MDVGASSWLEGGDLFHLYYRGSSEVDKHYTKPMLPWIISEVKNRKQKDPVRVEVTKGLVIVKDTSGVVVVSHAVRQIHKCVMEQADHSCFLYTLRTSEKENSNLPGVQGYVVAFDPSQPQPANFLADQNYQCHLFQADSEQEVRDFFTCLRKQPREVQTDGGNMGPCMASLPDLTVHNESQFFEVLFVGRVKVSHCKVPAAFIDEAIEAFKTKERLKTRMNIGESRQRYPSGGSVIYGQDGSSMSVPSITFANLHAEEDGGCSNRSRSNSKEHVEVPKDYAESKLQQQHSKVRFILGSSMDDDSGEDIQKKLHKETASSSTSTTTLTSVTETTALASAKSTSTSGSTVASTASTSTAAATASRTVFSSIADTTSSSTITTAPSASVHTSSLSSSIATSGSSDFSGTVSVDLCNLKSNTNSIVSGSSKEKMEESSDDTTETQDSQSQPRRQRMRTISGDSSHFFRKSHLMSDTPMRARAGSIGSAPLRQRSLKAGELEGRMLGQDFNRTMLFHIGRSEIQLINPEIKSVQLNKPFQDVAQCCRGLKNNDHFGFICREMNGDTSVYLGYVFRCQTSPVCDEIMQALSKSFAAVHEAQQREKQENLLCDQCPLRWFSQLCAEVEGLPATKAHMVIMKKISSLQEEERSLIIAKYEGAEVNDAQMQNNILMMLLRAHFESKQSMHTHTALPGGGVRPEYPSSSNLESSFRRAKKSLTTSFNQLLKRDGDKREGDSVDQEVPVKEDTANVSLSTEKSPSPATPAKVRLEGLSDSPLGFQRPRSSTVGASGGDAMRKEFLAKRAAAKHKPEPPRTKMNTTPKLNIFLKVGSPARHIPGEEEAEGTNATRRPLSFRHAILQRVVSPPKTQAGENIEHTGLQRTQTSSRDRQVQHCRSWETLKIIWKKAIFQQILLIRMERENRRLRALHQQEELQRVRLGYEEEDNVEEVEQAWMLMLSRPNSRIDASIMQSGIVQGIPKSLRGQVWQMMVHQHKLQNTKCDPDLPAFHLPYEDMLKDLTSQHHAILIDLGRTFPTHPYFSQALGSGQLALFNLLKAYSLLDKEVGYCQGLSFVGGILLLHVDEETAYHLLKHLMYVMGCRRQYRTDLHGLQKWLLRTSMTSSGPPTHLIATSWTIMYGAQLKKTLIVLPATPRTS
ncbi:TBC1 domain family member 1-like isoform X2 [Oratosquilla oratoria]|uniref:TBC1 domain family member 1-like isoform X2 n=1 Tax=Oratosquilla oratoria TaxID=337810 RepID=UPI003F759404